MKKILLVAVLCCRVAFSAQAHDFKPFRVDGGLGYDYLFASIDVGRTSKSLYSEGAVFYLEPKYAIINQISVGLRIEGAIFGGGSLFDATNGINASTSAAYLVTGDYYFTNNTFRPFGGIGLGVYSVGGIFSKHGSGPNFGFLVRAGFDVVHLRFSATYNYAGKSPELGAGMERPTLSYLSATIGFYIGGGKR